jgi:hypothetical protein
MRTKKYIKVDGKVVGFVDCPRTAAMIAGRFERMGKSVEVVEVPFVDAKSISTFCISTFCQAGE